MDEFELAVIKGNDELRPDDIKTILDNKDKWNDEEKVRFEKLTEEGFPEEKPAETPEEKEAREKEEAEAATKQKEEEEEKKKNEPTDEEKLEMKKLSTQKEIDEYVEQKKKEIKDAGGTKKDEKEEEKKIIEFIKYEKNEEGKLFIPKEREPKDWNDAFTKVVRHLQDHPDIILKGTAPQIREALRELEKEEKQIAENQNKEFDKEMQTMAKEGKVADPKTQEGKLVDYLITNMGASNGLTSMKEAYELWIKVAPEFGGGHGYKPGTPLWQVKDRKIVPIKPGEKTEEKKDTVIDQKKLASKVGGGGAPGGKTLPPKKYSDIHSKSMDELLS